MHIIIIINTKCVCTVSVEAKLTADNSGTGLIPATVAQGAPVVVQADFNPTLVWSGSASQTYLSLIAPEVWIWRAIIGVQLHSYVLVYT